MKRNAETDLIKVKKHAKSLWRKARKEGSPVKISSIYEQLARDAGCAHWYEYCVVMKKKSGAGDKTVYGDKVMELRTECLKQGNAEQCTNDMRSKQS